MLVLQLGLLFQTLVGAGYQDPSAIYVAPGQVVPVLVTELKTVLPATVGAQAVPLPTTLAGISVSLEQSLPANSWRLPMFAVAQFNRCPGTVTADCLVTAITVQIPYYITVPNPLLFTLIPQGYTTLTISENGVSSRSFLVQPVFDRVHILQSCDIGGRTEGGGICYPLVTHADGSLVLQDIRVNGQAQDHSEAQPGEVLVMYAYGLGPVTPPVQAGTLSPLRAAVATEPFYLRYDYSGNAAPAMPQTVGPPTVKDQLQFVGLTPGQVGLYQINFVVPAPPAGTAPCGVAGAQSNLTVGILAAGSFSFDGAAICVDPGTAAP